MTFLLDIIGFSILKARQVEMYIGHGSAFNAPSNWFCFDTQLLGSGETTIEIFNLKPDTDATLIENSLATLKWFEPKINSKM